jgi:hypothetical protein
MGEPGEEGPVPSLACAVSADEISWYGAPCEKSDLSPSVMRCAVGEFVISRDQKRGYSHCAKAERVMRLFRRESEILAGGVAGISAAAVKG